jgi:hypothetical protein
VLSEAWRRFHGLRVVHSTAARSRGRRTALAKPPKFAEKLFYLFDFQILFQLGEIFANRAGSTVFLRPGAQPGSFIHIVIHSDCG